MKVIILGGGLVGGPMAIDLAKEREFEITVVDVDLQALKRLEKFQVKIERSDLSKAENVTRLIADQDIVLNAVPGFMGFKTLRTIIESKKDVVDIAFFSEDPFELDDLARKNGVTAIVDCGVCPGMSNIIIGQLDQIMTIDTIQLYVGGLPHERKWPFEYKAGFSPVDVIEEYVRPARMVENYKVVSKPALSEPELMNFGKIGTLEAFNSDGVRSLIKTIKARNIVEKTLRYPGHIEKMAMLREMGLFDLNEIEVGGLKIRPRDLTAKLLFPMWEMKENDHDLTVLKLIAVGNADGKVLKYTYNMIDRYDTETKTTSMARTTGYTATAAVRLLSENLYKHKGISPPEFIGRDKKCVDFITEKLLERNIIYKETVEEL